MAVKLREVVNCHGCLRATRDWSEVEVRVAGRVALTWRLCRSCDLEVRDGAQQRVRELRGEAVQR